MGNKLRENSNIISLSNVLYKRQPPLYITRFYSHFRIEFFLSNLNTEGLLRTDGRREKHGYFYNIDYC